MGLKLKININLIAMLSLVSWYLVPYVSVKLGAVGFVVLFLIWVCTSKSNVLFKTFNSISWFICWYILVVLIILGGFFSGTSNILYYLLMTLAFAVPALFWAYYNELGDEKIISTLAKSLIVFSLICSLMTIIVLVTYPEAAKKLAMGDNYLNEIQFYYNLGCGGFGNIYGFVVMFVPLLLYRTENRFWKFLKFAALVLGCISVLMSLYTIALLLLLLSVSVFVLIKVYKRNILFGILLTIIIAFLLLRLEEVLGFISSALSNFGFDDTSGRINEVINALSGNSAGYNLSSRLSKYGESISLFIKHPIFGNQIFGGKIYGDHSSVFDELAKYGLLVYVFRIIFIVKTYNRQKRFTNFTFVVPYIIYVILAILNPTIYIYQIGFCLLFSSGILLKEGYHEDICH